MLDGLEWQRHEIRDVRENIGADDNAGSERERQRDVSSRLLDLAGGERDVVPGIGGKQRTGLRSQMATKRPNVAQGGEAGDDLDDSAACPQVPEVVGNRRADSNLSAGRPESGLREQPSWRS